LFIGIKKIYGMSQQNAAPNDPNLRIRVQFLNFFTIAGGQLQRLAQQKKER